jgi:hypothetical protein
MSFKPLEVALARAVEVAARAQSDLTTAQKRLGVEATPKQFFTAAEVRAVMRDHEEREQQNRLVIMDVCRMTYAPTKQELADKERARNAPPLTRENLAWIDLVSQAHEIMMAAEREKTTTVTAAAILRAGKIRRGEIVELPTGEAARAAIRHRADKE